MTSNKKDKNSAIRFFKIITTTSLEAGKLKVPNGFTRKHGGDVSNSNPVFLRLPDDKEWKIHWTKDQDGSIWFENGWTEFASYYSLDHGHLVLFEYKTPSPHFAVYIFDKSTLEIEYPFHDNLDQIVDERPPCKKSKLKSPEPCPQPSKKLRTCTSGNVGRSSKLPKLPQNAIGTKFEKSTFASTSKELDGNVGGGALESLKRNKLTRKSTKTPSFKVVMEPSYVYLYLHVPIEFEEKHLKNMQSDIIILHDMDGKTWQVKYLLGRRRISSGWRKFVLDNNLKVGDVCEFVLTKRQPLSFKVKISRLGGDQPHYTPPQESGVNGLDPAARIIDDESETTINRKALNQANEFTSELGNPYFSVQIKPNPSNRTVYRQLEVPSEFVGNYFSRKQCLMIRFENDYWPVKLNRYPKAGVCKLCRGWARLERENKLVAGDVCVFELINREDADAVPMLVLHVFKG